MVVPHKDELGWQTKIVNAVEAVGGYANKMSNRFLVGVPDLLLKFHNLPPALVEVKHEIILPGTQIINVGVTKLQALHLDRFAEAGGCAFWFMVGTYAADPRNILLLASNNTRDLKWEVKRAELVGTWARRNLPGPGLVSFLESSIAQLP